MKTSSATLMSSPVQELIEAEKALCPARIVFLDIDGVLNSEQSRDESGSLIEFSKKAVANLNEILSSTSALIVISSSWRIDWTLEEISRHLVRQGVASPKIVGKTPELADQPRGHEIQAWLDDAPFPVQSFVILDDRDDLHPNRLRHIQTDPAEGLTAHDAYRATSLLLKPD
jgi:hypothetical protein